MAGTCEHIGGIRDDWAPIDDPVCEECVRTGGSWVSLRRCLTCGHVGCCDSSPNRHASAHHQQTSHPMVRTLEPRQDWVWCYVDEVTLREADGRWQEIDLFYEAGLGYMREHVQAGGDPNVEESFMFGRGFPLGRWVAEMRRRRAAGDLGADQRADRRARGVALGRMSPRLGAERAATDSLPVNHGDEPPRESVDPGSYG